MSSNPQNPQVNCSLRFTVKISQHCIQGVCIYQLLITQDSSPIYSFYFRYNTLRALHEKSIKNFQYPQSLAFPKKILCRRTVKRDVEFQRFFDDFLKEINGNLSLNLSTFMALFNLKSDWAIECSAELKGLRKLQNPFLIIDSSPIKKEERTSIKQDKSGSKPPSMKTNPSPIKESLESRFKAPISPTQKRSTSQEESNEKKIVPKICFPGDIFKKASNFLTVIVNKKSFAFKEESFIGRGGYAQVYLYSLDGSDHPSHKFAVKLLSFPEGVDPALDRKSVV